MVRTPRIEVIEVLLEVSDRVEGRLGDDRRSLGNRHDQQSCKGENAEDAVDMEERGELVKWYAVIDE